MEWDTTENKHQIKFVVYNTQGIDKNMKDQCHFLER